MPHGHQVHIPGVIHALSREEHGKFREELDHPFRCLQGELWVDQTM
eukprot:CAMPEP_0172635466 /NCGR_PEP_ID=MMETSP1068-20121228/199533_1 /TAXON_ID=35684 /ORGANISM="Pseudopedinella elastica, Strain CCMP716" /LENGTH=45 /DNA_ID= /DNA_START= /DNA_END= /DNA_ORIENTATION=